MSIIGGIMVPHPPLIVPEVGRGSELKIKDTVKAYQEAVKMVSEAKPDTIILISPHSESFSDTFKVTPGEGDTGDLKRFGASNFKINVKYDREFVNELYSLTEDNNFPVTIYGNEKNLDHASLIPLYFLNQEYPTYQVVRISLSGLSASKHYELGMYIQKVASKLNKKYFVIASGDLSHKLKDDGPYGFAEEGPLYDKLVMADMSSGNFYNMLNYKPSFLEKAAICGHMGFCIMGGIFDGYKLECHKLSYEGPFGVGYGICTYKVIGEGNTHYLAEWQKDHSNRLKNQEDEYIALARRTIENYIREGKIIDTKGVSQEILNKKGGVFVSIHEDNKLRGCIGTIIGVEDNMALEIIHNAISAATKDYRFSPITKDELPYLEIKVDELGESEIIKSKSELDVKKYGVICTSGYKRGLLLPNLDNVTNVDDQVSIALSKGGISPDEDYVMERFEVIRHQVGDADD